MKKDLVCAGLFFRFHLLYIICIMRRTDKREWWGERP
jgi:hypothetical protein